ncbi:MAG: hypothetical protein GY944_01985 [bacterium]|nr:hypothetical protein [bacterium]
MATRNPLITAVLVAGLLLSIVQQTAIVDEVFVSGDGGIKALVAKQFARGDWHADLRLSAEPWIEELWASGFYPFGPPFAYQREGRWFIQYPVPFMAVTAPFYAALGFRGLTVAPLLGLWLFWFSCAAILRRLGVSPAGSALALAGLVFATYITPYGAMYWEHTPSLGLSFLGFALLLGPRAQTGDTRLHLGAGILLGLSAWFRPESAAFAAGAGLALLVLGRPLRAVVVTGTGALIMGLLFAGCNLWLYGSLFGVHAVQQVDPLTAHVAHERWWEIGAYFAGQLYRYCPVVIVAAVTALVGARTQALRIDRREAALWILFAISAMGTALMVPNNGGTQLGARYFLHALPPLFFLLGAAWDRAACLETLGRRSLRGALAIGLIAGVYLCGVRGTQAVFNEYRYRALPAVEAIRADPNPVVVVEHQWMAQDLESILDQKAFFRVRTPDELEQLARALASRGQTRFTLMRYEGLEASVIETPGLRLELTPRGRFGTYVLVDCLVTSASDRG